MHAIIVSGLSRSNSEIVPVTPTFCSKTSGPSAKCQPMRWSFFWLVGALTLAGCARHQQPVSPGESGSVATSKTAKSPTVIVTPAPVNAGRITSVNPAGRFVVITYPIGVPLPSLEQKLDVYRAGLKVAEIKITGPARDLNTVADITAGECQPGDEVRAN